MASESLFGLSETFGTRVAVLYGVSETVEDRGVGAGAKSGEMTGD